MAVSWSVSNPELPFEYLQPRWYAAYTRPRHEKRVAGQLEVNSVETFLPLYQEIHTWKNGRAHVMMPLFPGYVFVRIPLAERLKVLQLPSVVRLVSIAGHPCPLPEGEIETLQSCLSSNLHAEPHPYIAAGTSVRVDSGPLAGLAGVVVREKGRLRLVVSIDLIMRSILVEVDAADLHVESSPIAWVGSRHLSVESAKQAA